MGMTPYLGSGGSEGCAGSNRGYHEESTTVAKKWHQGKETEMSGHSTTVLPLVGLHDL